MKKHNKVFKILFMVMVIVLMTGCETIDTVDFNEDCVLCGDETYFPAYLVKLVANIIGFIQVMVPVIIILVGMIELFKAVIASDEKKMSESKDSLIRKIIAGVMIYLVIAVIQFAFTAVPNFTDGDIDVMECMSYFINGPEGVTYCPDRVNGNAVSLKDRDEQANVNIENPVDRKDYEEDENGNKYKNIDPDYGWCHDQEKNACKSRGCVWCGDNESCAAPGECKAKYKCYKCGTGSNATYEWSSTKHSGCTALTTYNFETCNAIKAKNNARCYECNDGSYIWTVNAGTGCYATNKASTSEGCKNLNK